MNEMAINLNESRNFAFEKIDKELLKARFSTIKDILIQKGFEIPKDINDLKTLKKHFKDKLTPTEWNSMEKALNNAEDEFAKVIRKLKDGSTTAFSDFLVNLTKIFKSIGKIAVNSLAINTISTLAPTLTLKLAFSGLIILKNAISIQKNKKFVQIANKNSVCNLILNELELTKNENGEIVDTRFNQDIVKRIKSFLDRNKIEYKDFGYLSLKECIYNLPLNQKIALVSIVNREKGEPFNIDELLKKYDKKTLKKLNENLTFPILIGGTTASATTLAINFKNPELLEKANNSLILQPIISKLADSKVVEWLSNLFANSKDLLSNIIPTIGENIENELLYKNLALNTIIGSIGAIGINALIKGHKNIKDSSKKMAITKKYSAAMKLDAKLYEKEIIEEITKQQKFYELNGPNTEEKAIIILVLKYIEELGIKIDKKINSINELQIFIKNLDSDKREKIKKFLNKLDSLRKNNYSQFLVNINKIGNIIYLLSSLSLAGLSIIDIINDGEFLNNLSTQLFDSKEEPNLLNSHEETILNNQNHKKQFIRKPIDNDTDILERIQKNTSNTDKNRFRNAASTNLNVDKNSFSEKLVENLKQLRQKKSAESIKDHLEKIQETIPPKEVYGPELPKGYLEQEQPISPKPTIEPISPMTTPSPDSAVVNFEYKPEPTPTLPPDNNSNSQIISPDNNVSAPTIPMTSRTKEQLLYIDLMNELTYNLDFINNLPVEELYAKLVETAKISDYLTKEYCNNISLDAIQKLSDYLNNFKNSISSQQELIINALNKRINDYNEAVKAYNEALEVANEITQEIVEAQQPSRLIPITTSIVNSIQEGEIESTKRKK